MTLEQFLSRYFPGARRNGDGWMAGCSAHDDRNPSLSITERDAKILLYCHAGCPTEAVCAALGINMSDLSIQDRQEHRITATYDYADENGSLLYQVLRYEPKGFRQRRPDGNGGWIPSLKGTRRVLYRLAEALKATLVLICEGEKDCETAAKLGLTATCNSAGAGKWREEYSECLRGKRVAIIADADEPGRKHAQQVAQSLKAKVLALKMLELPGAKDLTEWVERGGTRLALSELIRSAPEWTSSVAANASDADGFRLASIGDLLDRPEVETEWLWQGRLAVGTVSAVVSKPKVGKSTLARNLALAVARGESFLGILCKRGPVVYLALEERAEDVTADFRSMGATREDEILIHADSAPAAGILAAANLLRERKPALIVIDPLFRLAQIRDEKAYAETYAALGPLIDAARASGAHVLLTHHSGKSAKADPIDAPLGSTAIGGAVSTLIVLRRTEQYRLIQTVQRLGQDLPETVIQFDDQSHTLSLGGSKLDADRKGGERAILDFLASVGEPQTQAQIREEVKGDIRVNRAALTALAASGKVKKTGEGTRGKPFVYEYWFAGTQDNPNTSKPETQNGQETRINSGDKVVCDKQANPILVCGIETSEEEGELRL